MPMAFDCPPSLPLPLDTSPSSWLDCHETRRHRCQCQMCPVSRVHDLNRSPGSLPAPKDARELYLFQRGWRREGGRWQRGTSLPRVSSHCGSGTLEIGNYEASEAEYAEASQVEVSNQIGRGILQKNPNIFCDSFLRLLNQKEA